MYTKKTQEFNPAKRFNLWKLAEDLGSTMTEMSEIVGLKPSQLIRYREETMSDMVLNRVTDAVLTLTDNPENYYFSVVPYSPSRGRYKGDKNKNGSCKVLSVEEYQRKKAIEAAQEHKYKRKPETIKKSLYSAEEIISALHTGLIIYQDGTKYTYQEIDGYIVKSNNEEQVFISPAIDLSQAYYTYIEKPIEIVQGATYYTRNDEQAMIVGYNEELSSFVGYILNGQLQPIYYNNDGKLATCNPKEVDPDLTIVKLKD